MTIHRAVAFFSFPFLLFRNRKINPTPTRQIPTINDTIEMVCMISALGTGTKSGIGKFILSPPSILLDAEVSRTAEEIDICKIERILQMIEMCGNHAKENDIDKFTENFNCKYHTSIKAVKKSPKNRIMSRFLRIASCFILFVFLFCGMELVAVKTAG